MVDGQGDAEMVRTKRYASCGVIWALVGGIISCSSGNLPPFDGNIALGTWGGDSAGMIVSDTAMHLHINCTYGDVSGRVPVGITGEFGVIGSYTLRAYPIAVGPSLPAQFVGRLEGDQVTVTVTVTDTVEHQTVVHGPVIVKFGDDPRLGPCPICRRPIVTQRRLATIRW
jgi:hypothetical protein